MVFTLAEKAIPLHRGSEQRQPRHPRRRWRSRLDGNDQADDEITHHDRRRRITSTKSWPTIRWKAWPNRSSSLINAGDGDPLVYASANYRHWPRSLILTARAEGADGDSVTIAGTTSDSAKIFVTATGANLAGGKDAAKIAPGHPGSDRRREPGRSDRRRLRPTRKSLPDTTGRRARSTSTAFGRRCCSFRPHRSTPRSLSMLNDTHQRQCLCAGPMERRPVDRHQPCSGADHSSESRHFRL